MRLETLYIDIKMKNEFQWWIRMVLSIYISFINNLWQHYHSTNHTITTLSLSTPHHTLHHGLNHPHSIIPFPVPSPTKQFFCFWFIHSITASSTHLATQMQSNSIQHSVTLTHFFTHTLNHALHSLSYIPMWTWEFERTELPCSDFQCVCIF